MTRVALVAATCAAVAIGAPSFAGAAPVRVGSKVFTESVVLAEILVHLGKDAGVEVEHRREIGGTRLVWEALKSGEIDLYTEYTGTIRGEIHAGEALEGDDALRDRLRADGVVMSAPLGFDDTYALGMKEAVAAEAGVVKISDLRARPALRFGMGNEFLDRKDGWPSLRDRYRLPQTPRGLDHDLAYRALGAGDLDVIDLYSTDAEIAFYGLRVLEDDLDHFPPYAAVVLYRSDLADKAPPLVRAIDRLAGLLDEKKMSAMNAAVKLDKKTEAEVAAGFLRETLGTNSEAKRETRLDRLWTTTRAHLWLVAISVMIGVILAVPIGVLAYRRPRLGQLLLGAVGVLQTIPSLALLVVLVPLLGLGETSAIVALVLYGLLPIVRGTHTGLASIPQTLRESAIALGLSARFRLLRVELPLALPSIFAGISTAAVVTVGTATLGALIGAGGYGQPIITGIRLARTDLILEGAVPAAVLALLVQLSLDSLARALLPRGMKPRAHV